MSDSIKQLLEDMGAVAALTNDDGLRIFRDRLEALIGEPDMWLDDVKWEAVTPEDKDAYHPDEAAFYSIPLYSLE